MDGFDISVVNLLLETYFMKANGPYRPSIGNGILVPDTVSHSTGLCSGNGSGTCMQKVPRVES
jgi:hypothetical protein